LILLLVLLPFLEMVLLLLLADWTSWQVALLFVVLTGVAGAVLIRFQGLRAGRRIRQDLAAGRMPANAVWDAAMILVSGALLLTPGVLTDLFAVTLLLPPCRRLYRAALVRWFRSRTTLLYRSVPGGHPPESHPDVIDSYVVKRHNDPA